MVAIRCESVIVLCAFTINMASAFTFMAAHRGHKMSLKAEPEAAESHSKEFEKALSAMTTFSNRYVKLTDTKCALQLFLVITYEPSGIAPNRA